LDIAFTLLEGLLCGLSQALGFFGRDAVARLVLSLPELRHHFADVSGLSDFSLFLLLLGFLSSFFLFLLSLGVFLFDQLLFFFLGLFLLFRLGL